MKINNKFWKWSIFLGRYFQGSICTLQIFGSNLVWYGNAIIFPSFKMPQKF